VNGAQRQPLRVEAAPAKLVAFDRGGELDRRRHAVGTAS